MFSNIQCCMLWGLYMWVVVYLGVVQIGCCIFG